MMSLMTWRGLPIGPYHERDAAVAVHTEVEPLEQVRTLHTRVAKGHVDEGQHGRRQLAAVREAELERLPRTVRPASYCSPRRRMSCNSRYEG